MSELLEVKNLKKYFKTPHGMLHAVDDVTFSIDKQKTLGVVGESGCGKSVTSLSLMQLVQRPSGQTVEGEIRFNAGDKAYNVVNAPASVMQKLRGNSMGMIFQEPMTSLNPVKKVGWQIEEALRIHRNLPDEELKAAAIEVMRNVEIPEPEKRYYQYPHELSGGLRQRVMIAAALICDPKLLIADEPTTALDVTIQAQIIELLKSINKKMGTAILFISHDLSVVKTLCSRVLVMNKGRIVETGPVQDVFEHPKEEYTRNLIEAIPKFQKIDFF